MARYYYSHDILFYERLMPSAQNWGDFPRVVCLVFGRAWFHQYCSMGGLYAQAHRQRRRSDLFWPWGLIRHCQVKRKNFRTNYHKYSRKPKWIPTSHFPQRSLKKETQHYPEHDSKNGVWPQIDLIPPLQLISKRWNLIKRYLASYRLLIMLAFPNGSMPCF